MSQPVRAEWASGRRGPITTSLLLFLFGAAVLLGGAVVASQSGVGVRTGIPVLWAATAAVWGIGAVLLAFGTGKAGSGLLEIAALLWWLPLWLIVIEGGRLGLF